MTAPADAIFRGDHTVVNLLLFHDAAMMHLMKKEMEGSKCSSWLLFHDKVMR